jgi:chaperonin GroEL (HSP60 family)
MNHDILMDGINAVKNSIKYGIIPGGGCSLLYMSQLLDYIKTNDLDFNKGVSIYQ